MNAPNAATLNTLRNATARRILSKAHAAPELHWVTESIAFTSIVEAEVYRDTLLTFGVPCRATPMGNDRAMLRLI